MLSRTETVTICNRYLSADTSTGTGLMREHWRLTTITGAAWVLDDRRNQDGTERKNTGTVSVRVDNVRGYVEPAMFKRTKADGWTVQPDDYIVKGAFTHDPTSNILDELRASGREFIRAESVKDNRIGFLDHIHIKGPHG